MPKFEAGTTYQFAVLDSSNKQKSSFKRVYLRRERDLELFQHPTAGWLESFTREQLADFQVTEVRK